MYQYKREKKQNKTLGRSPQKQTTNQKKKSYLHRTKKKNNFETLNREIRKQWKINKKKNQISFGKPEQK